MHHDHETIVLSLGGPEDAQAYTELLAELRRARLAEAATKPGVDLRLLAARVVMGELFPVDAGPIAARRLPRDWRARLASEVGGRRVEAVEIVPGDEGLLLHVHLS